MLEGHNIVYFAPEKWDGLWRNRQQLMSVFARQNRVLIVEPRLHLRQVRASLRQGQLKLSDLNRPILRQVAQNLYIFRYPEWLPISGRFPLNKFTKITRHLFIRNALQTLSMTRPIVWFSRPQMISLLDEIGPASLRVYHVVDEYTAYSNQKEFRRWRAAEREKLMLSQVDAVVVVSKKLYEAKHSFNPNTHLVPNGVDYQAYSTALAEPCLPDDLKVIEKPRLGYIGLIGDKLNFDMLKDVALEHPEWSLIFLGQVAVSGQSAAAWQTLKALPNVYHLGPVDVARVPHYVKGFQVGLMPYVQNRHAEHISPLKLYDYLAAGLPVASVDIPSVRQFSQYIHVAESPPHFSTAVQAALLDTTSEHWHTRRNIAAGHTWEARVEQISDILQAQLAAKALPTNGLVPAQNQF